MKKYHAIALVLSALSASLLISCVKPQDEQPKDDNSSIIDANKNKDTTQLAQEIKNEQQANEQIFKQEGQQSNTGQANTAADANPQQQLPPGISAKAQQIYLIHVANDFIIPAYQDAVNQSEMLAKMAKKQCDKGTVQGENLLAIRGQWIKLAQAWAAAEMVDFGPATKNMNNLYINYFPDERGLVHNDVNELINRSPNISAEALAQESAVVQGVPGLEEVLFANNTLDQAQCQYVLAASTALTQRLDGITSAWQDNAVDLLALDQTEQTDKGLNQWFNSILTMVETLKTVSFAEPLGLEAKAKGHVPAATAKQSRAIINAKLATLNKVLTDPVLTAMLQNTDKDAAIGDDLSATLAEASSVLAQMPADITEAEKANQQKLYTLLTEVTKTIKQQLIPALKVRVGFNRTDGD